MVGEDTHGHGRYVPAVVDVPEPLSDLHGCRGTCLPDAHHLGEDALTDAVVGKLLRGRDEGVVVGRQDEVFATSETTACPLLSAGMVVDVGQAAVIQDVVLQDGIPIGGTQPVIAEVSVASFKTNVDVDFAVDGELVCHRVVLERTETEVDNVDAAQTLWLGHQVALGRVEGIGGIHFRIPEERPFGLALGLAAFRRCDVDASHALAASRPDFHDGFRALWDGDEAVEGGQRGQAIVVGRYDAFCRYGVHHLTFVHDRVDPEVAQVEVKADMAAVGRHDGEGLSHSGVCCRKRKQ